MKLARFLSLMVIACLVMPASRGQIVKLFGEVTHVTGVLNDQFSLGDPVTLTFDLTPPLVDYLQGLGLPHGTVLYEVPITLDIAGIAPWLGLTSVFVLDRPGEHGLFVNSGWEEYDSTPGAELYQAFYSERDILSSYTYFPPNIPISDFVTPVGHYYNDSSQPTGTVEWLITRYNGYGGTPPTMTPVPEPSTYGLLAMAGLIGVVLVRRLNRRL